MAKPWVCAKALFPALKGQHKKPPPPQVVLPIQGKYFFFPVPPGLRPGLSCIVPVAHELRIAPIKIYVEPKNQFNTPPVYISVLNISVEKLVEDGLFSNAKDMAVGTGKTNTAPQVEEMAQNDYGQNDFFRSRCNESSCP